MSAPVITEPGFYTLDEQVYHADPCVKPSLSSGIAATLVTATPRDAWFRHPRLNPSIEPRDEKKFDLGTVAHALVTGVGPKLIIIDADTWATKAAKDARASAIADGCQPVLAKVNEQALAMREALFDQLACDRDNHDAFTNGVGEQAVFWKEQTFAGQLWCRALVDWRMNERPAIYDYKTFDGERGADPENFVKHIISGGRDVQDPHYSRGVASVLGLKPEDVVFRFVVQCPKPPHLISVVELDGQAKEFAGERWNYALSRWARCAATGQWPGFAPRTHHVSPPGWAMVQWESKLLAEEHLDRVERRDAEAA